MAYEYYNAHPKGLRVNDCVKRSISLAAQMDYMEVSRELNRYKKVTGAKSFNSDRNCFKYVEQVLKAKKLSFPAVKGKPRMNGSSFCYNYPKGRYILNMAGHWSCCVDGIIYDTWDCSDKCVYTAYEIGNEEELQQQEKKYLIYDKQEKQYWGRCWSMAIEKEHLKDYYYHNINTAKKIASYYNTSAETKNRFKVVEVI